MWDEQPRIEESTPQGWTEALLASGSYFSFPTPLQLASYNARTVQLCTSTHHEEALRQMLSCGISLNACNIHGESLMHKACRLGFHHVLRGFLEFEPDLPVCDSQGRTLLDYVQTEHDSFWIDFLEHNTERFWRHLDGEVLPPAPTTVTEGPHYRPIAEPNKQLPCELAAMVAAGRMTPGAALVLTAAVCQGDDDSDDDDESTSGDEYENDASECSSDFSMSWGCFCRQGYSHRLKSCKSGVNEVHGVVKLSRKTISSTAGRLLEV